MNRRLPLARFSLTAGMTLALLSSTAVPVVAATPVYVDDDGACAGQSPCFTTIGEGIANAGPAPAVVRVFPGAYAESVDLAQMGSAIAGSPGTLTLRTVNASNEPTAGTATIDPAAGAAIHGSVPGSLTIIGFDVRSATTSAISVDATEVALVDITSSASGNDGIVALGSAAVTVRRVSSSGSSGLGFDLQGGATTVVTVVDSHADGNADGGWNINFPYGSDSTVSVSGSSGDDNGNQGWNINHGDDGDVTISDLTANDNSGGGLNVNFGGSGQVSITNARASRNANTGINVNYGASGAVSLEDVTANENAGGGVNVNNGATVTVDDVVTNANDGQGLHVGGSGAVTVVDATSRDNVRDGFRIDTTGSTTMSHVTALQNGHDGIDVTNAASISGAWVQGHVDERTGIELGSGTVADSIVCGNEEGTTGAAAAVGVWWGSRTGPAAAGNPGGTGDTTDAADFTPFISDFGGTAGAARRGEASSVRFTFTGGARDLAAAPGSRTGPLPFRVSTGNGVVRFGSSSGSSVGARLNANGVLAVSLTPARSGTATVSVDGPCGLDTRLVIDVAGRSGGGGGGTVPTMPPTNTVSGPALESQAGGAILLLALTGVLGLVFGVLAATPGRRRTRG